MKAAMPKPLHWIGGSYNELCELPRVVVHNVGYALYLAQIGGKLPNVKPLKGFTGAGVLEIVETMTAILTVRFIRSSLLKGCMCYTPFRRNRSLGSKRPNRRWT